MLTSLLRRLFGVKRAPLSLKARLGLDAIEDRVVPASVTFDSGVLLVQADQTTDDVVIITAAGTASDGSTGVRLFTNVTGTLQSQRFGDASHPVTNVALDLKDGNDVVAVASLRSAVVLVGEGNGNNVVLVGDTLAGGVIAGSGQNLISVGNGTKTDAFGSFNLPGTAGSAAFVGWGYTFADGGRAFFLNGNTGNEHDNVVVMRSDTGFVSFVDIVGNGNNVVLTEDGNDEVSIIGNGDNVVFTGAGDDLVIIQGSGNNVVDLGTGEGPAAAATVGGHTTGHGRGHGSLADCGALNRAHAWQSNPPTADDLT